MPQRVLITAGAAGIGREFARAFAATGASVFVCDIDTKAIEAIAKEIPGVIARPCDMARRADIERMVPDAVARLGGLDVLINNAGISGMTLPVADYPPDDWDKVVAVNLTAMFDVTRLAIPHLKLSKAGVIINMSSVAGRLWLFATRSPYAATKWAVIGFTKTLAIGARRMGHPAPTRSRPARSRATASSASSPAAPRSAAGRSRRCAPQAMAAQSIKAMIKPKDIAALAVFLASDAAKSISGQVLPIDNDRQRA